MGSNTQYFAEALTDAIKLHVHAKYPKVNINHWSHHDYVTDEFEFATIDIAVPSSSLGKHQYCNIHINENETIYRNAKYEYNDPDMISKILQAVMNWIENG